MGGLWEESNQGDHDIIVIDEDSTLQNPRGPILLPDPLGPGPACLSCSEAAGGGQEVQRTKEL